MIQVKDDEGYDWVYDIIDGLDQESYAKFAVANIKQMKNDVKMRREKGEYELVNTWFGQEMQQYKIFDVDDHESKVDLELFIKWVENRQRRAEEDAELEYLIKHASKIDWI